MIRFLAVCGVIFFSKLMMRFLQMFLVYSYKKIVRILFGLFTV